MSEKTERKNSVFASRNFRLVFLGALVSELGATLSSFAISFYILEISDNNALLQGVFLAVCGVVLLLVTPVGGVFGDRFNKAKIMVLCDYIKGALFLLAAAAMLIAPSHAAHIVILFVLGILGNIIGGIFSPAAGSLFPHIVEEDQLQQANAFFTIKSSLLVIIGVLLAGILYAVLPVTLLFFVVGLCYIGSGISEMFIRYEHRPAAEKLTLRLALSDMGDGLRYLKTQRALLTLMGAILFINFFIAPLSGNFLPYFIKTDVAGAPGYLFDKILTPELWDSVFGMLSGASSLLGAAILSSRPQKDKCGVSSARKIGLMALQLIALTAAYYILVERGVSLNAFLILFGIGCLLIGWLLSYINIPISTTIMRVVDRDKLSKVSSIISVLSQGLVPIASVAAGFILQLFGSSALLAFCSAGFTAAALMLLFSKRVREI